MFDDKKLAWAALPLIVFLSAGCGAPPEAPPQEGGFTIAGSRADEASEQVSFAGLFADGKRFENFRNMDRFGPSRAIPPAENSSVLPEKKRDIGFSADYLGRSTSLEQFLAQSGSAAFLAIVDGTIVGERYFHGNHPAAQHAGFSMTKSFVSALVGAAIAEGYIGGVDDMVRQYIPELTSDTFTGVTIKHALQMSSGIQFNEDYSDPQSDINKMSYMVQHMPYVEYMNTLDRAHEPGIFNLYASINTQLLGTVVSRATGRSLSDYLQEKLWQPMGMEYGAQWMLDAWGQELPMGGLSVSLRDYGRLGLLYLNNGQWQGRQVLPASWVRGSVVPDAPHLEPGDNPKSSHHFGYQYQWWIPQQPDGDFMALGIWGQFIYVDPKRNVVLVKLSADASSFSPEVKAAQLVYLQALSRHLAAPPSAP